MPLLEYIHRLVDYALGLLRLLQNREVGWQTLNRKTGKYEREQQPLLKKLKLVLLFNPLTEWIDQTHLFRLWIHEKTMTAGKTTNSAIPRSLAQPATKGQQEATALSATQIQAFINFYHIKMEDFEPSDPRAYATFEDFFVRRHNPASRPIFKENDMAKAIAVADSRVVVFPSVSQTKALWIKGRNFTIENLILDRQKAGIWRNGAVASFRLSPQDYHRYCSPVSGRVRWFHQISGDYYQVDPVCISSRVDILTRNARCCIGIETDEFGMVLFVAIGATNVGSVAYVLSF
jgi:phosphatidylserine decarboxylase